jgi:hypothetical protein
VLTQVEIVLVQSCHHLSDDQTVTGNETRGLLGRGLIKPERCSLVSLGDQRFGQGDERLNVHAFAGIQTRQQLGEGIQPVHMQAPLPQHHLQVAHAAGNNSQRRIQSFAQTELCAGSVRIGLDQA